MDATNNRKVAHGRLNQFEGGFKSRGDIKALQATHKPAAAAAVASDGHRRYNRPIKTTVAARDNARFAYLSSSSALNGDTAMYPSINALCAHQTAGRETRRASRVGLNRRVSADQLHAGLYIRRARSFFTDLISRQLSTIPSGR